MAEALRAIDLDGIWASPLQRARRTAEIIGQSLGMAAPQFTDQLKEVSLPLWEGMPFKEAEARYPEAFDRWSRDPANLVMSVPQAGNDPPLEFYPIRALYQQANACWQTLLDQHQGQTLLVVAHSAINRALIGTALGLGPDSFHSLQQSNCNISVLNFAAGWQSPVQLEAMNLTSHLGQPLPEIRPSHRGPRMLLVRHGETDWNRQGRFQGQIDVPLNDTGRSQGGKAASFLHPVCLDAAYTSSMARPRETAEIILQHHPHLNLQALEDLREISHGDWEGLYREDIEADYPELLQQWQSAPETVQMPGGENLHQVWERSIRAWQQLVATHSHSDKTETVLVVAHDAVNKALLCHVLGLGPEAFWRFKQGNGAVSVIDYPGGADSNPVLTSANITTHLSGSVLDKTAAGAL